MESLMDLIWGNVEIDDESDEGIDPQENPMKRPCMIALCDGQLKSACNGCAFPAALAAVC